MDIQARGSVTLTGGSYSCKNPLLFFWADLRQRLPYRRCLDLPGRARRLRASAFSLLALLLALVYLLWIGKLVLGTRQLHDFAFGGAEISLFFSFPGWPWMSGTSGATAPRAWKIWIIFPGLLHPRRAEPPGGRHDHHPGWKIDLRAAWGRRLQDHK